MTDAPLDDLRRRLEEAWRRFLALPPRLKALAFGGGAFLVALAVVVSVLALSGGDDSSEPAAFEPSATADATPTPRPTPSPTATATPTPGATATAASTPTEAPPPSPTEPPAPVPTPTPVPRPSPTPAAGGYGLSRVLPSANWNLMVGFATVPGAPNEAAVITQKAGEVYKVYLSGAAPVKMGDLTPLMAASLATEEGLLGIAFSPNFQSDHRVYFYYTADDGCSAGFERCSVISRFTVNGNTIDMASEVEIFRVDQPFANHNGGHLAFDPRNPAYLYVSLGDGGSAGDPEGHGQDPDLLGSIARVNVSGNGPFSPQTFAIGFRNPWRFSFDRATGQLWAGDVGQGTWEEVDRVVQGGNYGWRCREGFAVFRAGGCPAGGFVDPRVVYDHSGGNCSITGGYVYRGSAMPELRGWFVYGDYCSGRIWAVNTVGSGPAVLLADTNVSISSFGELPSGELVVLTFQNAIYRLVRA